jgi:serine/threonine-protein kinase
VTPFGPYSLLRKIATGGTAEIFLARRHGVDGFARHLAIKRILPHLESEPAFIQLLLDEARLAAHLHHGHIIPIHEVGVVDGQAYIAMEYLPGTDLGRLLRSARRRRRRVLLLTPDAPQREAIAKAFAARLNVEVLLAADRAAALAHSASGPLDLAVVEAGLLGPIRDPLMHELQAAHPELLRVLLLGPTAGRRAGCYALATDLREPAAIAALAQQCLAATLPLELTLQIVRAVAEALEYAHTAADFAGQPLHVVHRDVNPSNILVSLGGVVKLVDFGIAKATVRARDEGRGNFVGTVNYMCPEQATGQEPDPRGDQFSLGTVFHELVTGRHPFAGENEFQTLRFIQERHPRPVAELVPGVPEVISATCARALSKSVADRHPSMAHFLGDIEDTVRREGLNLSPKRMARFLDVVYSDQERAGFGLSSTGYETPATPLARVTATATPAAPSSAVQAAPRRAAAPAIEIEVDLDDLDDETVDDLDALESVEKTPPPRVGPPPTGRGRTGMGR